MRLEVLIDSEDPIIYPLNKNKLIIGSAESADIIINVDGVSRKHLILSAENDQFSVTDQGSTNGTYINEERLIPGKRVDFTSFFPVRLGDRVLLSLLSDDEDSPFSSLQEAVRRERTNPAMTKPVASSSNESATRSINLKQLQQSQATKKLQDQRKKIIQDKHSGKPSRKKGKKDSSSDKQRMIVTQVIVAALVCGAIYFQFFTDEPAPVVLTEQTPVTEVKPATPVEPQITLIPEQELASIEEITQTYQSIKCATATEKGLCDIFFQAGVKDGEGIVETPGFINIFIDQTLFYEHARERMGITTPESLQRSRLSAEDWKKLAYIIFFNEKLLSIAPGQLPAKPINYVFFTPEGESKVTGVMTIRSENYPEALKALRGGNLKTVREYGLFTYQAMLKFIQFY